MEPYLGKTVFNLAGLLVILTLVPLAFLRVESAEFLVDILALIFTLSLLSFVIWDVKRQSRRESSP